MKRIFAGLMCVLIVLSLCGCGEEPLPYNMKQITGATFNEKFLLSHSTYGVMHWRDYIDEDGEKKSEMWIDKDSPSRRSVIIDNSDDFNEAFSYYNKSGMPNFETKMIAILFFTHSSKGCDVTKAKIVDDVLYLGYKSYHPNMLAPYILDYLIVEMDQYYITQVDKWEYMFCV